MWKQRRLLAVVVSVSDSISFLSVENPCSSTVVCQPLPGLKKYKLSGYREKVPREKICFSREDFNKSGQQ